MRFDSVFGLVFLAVLGAAEDIDPNDLPQACLDDCSDLVSLSQKCESKTEGDSAFNDCVCKDGGAKGAFNSCAACLREHSSLVKDDDVQSLMETCGLDYVGASATSGASSGASATGTSKTASAATMTVTSTSGSSTIVITTTATQVEGSQTASGSASGTASGGAASSTGTGAAAHATAGVGALLAGVVMGWPALI